jgi:hypothetical protein
LAVFLFRGFQALFQGEEGRVRKFILEGKRAVEAKNILSCASMVADSYEDKYGNDRRNLIFAAKNFFAYYQGIFINIEKMEIKLNESGDKAEVDMVALILCRLQDDTAEHIFEKEKGRFMVRLSKVDRKWKLQEIEFLEQVSVMGHKIT